jgi:hypothetical protein
VRRYCHFDKPHKMTEKTWGGRREGAGRPKLEDKRKLRGIKFYDEEWALIKGKAKAKKMPLREYLYLLAERDNDQQ